MLRKFSKTFVWLHDFVTFRDKCLPLWKEPEWIRKKLRSYMTDKLNRLTLFYKGVSRVLTIYSPNGPNNHNKSIVRRAWMILIDNSSRRATGHSEHSTGGCVLGFPFTFLSVVSLWNVDSCEEQTVWNSCRSQLESSAISEDRKWFTLGLHWSSRSPRLFGTASFHSLFFQLFYS